MYVIFGHKKDLNGMCSVLFALYNLTQKGIPRNQIRIHLVNYREFIPALTEYVSENPTPIFIVLNLGKSSFIFDVYRKIIAQLPEKGGKMNIYLDDHAPIPNSEFLKDLFPIMQNPADPSLPFEGDKMWQGKLKVAANLAFEHFIKAEELDYPPHFDTLLQAAFDSEYLQDFSVSNAKMAIRLNDYIGFNQAEPKKLRELLDIFLDPLKYLEFFEDLEMDQQYIHDWMTEETDYIKRSFKEISQDGKKIIAADAEIRSGEIAKFLEEMHPKYDLYIGYSRQDQYVTIRSPHKVADKIAIIFEGGGHPNKASFPAPENSSHDDLWGKIIGAFFKAID